MANYATLKAAIADVVKTNGEQAITGANLQTVLLSIVNSIGADYTFAGVATPSTSAGTPDQNVFYVGGAGTYDNFGSSYVVQDGSIGLFQYNGTWTKTSITVVQLKMKIEGTPFVDLAIGDVNGNDLVQFYDGNVKTKNFDSVNVLQSEPSEYDLAIGDIYGRDILWCRNGHIYTKNFSSEAIGYKAYQQKTLFHFNVDCSMPYMPYVSDVNSFTSADPLADVIAQKVYEDRAALYLPNSYSAIGQPTRLVILGRQGKGTFTDNTDYAQHDINTDGTNYLNIVPYLLYLGYAVLALDGTPDGWASEMMEDAYVGEGSRPFDGQVNGNYVSVRSARIVYDKIIREYNIRKDGVFGFGYSQGGWMIMNIAELSGIPFLAVCLKSPVVNLDGYFDAYNSDGVTFKGGTVISDGGIEYPRWRYFMVRQYYGINPAKQEMSLSDFLAIPKQSWRWGGYDPFRRYAQDVPTAEAVSAIDDNQPLEEQLLQFSMRRSCHFPVKLWIAKNDDNVGYKYQSLLIQAMRNAGVYADIKVYSSGGHSLEPSTWGSNIVGHFTYNNTQYRIFPPTYEWAQFFEDNGGNPVIFD